MKVSILMAVFNGENYLDDAVTSVINQSYSNIELIICNDGSTDSTRLLLDKYTNQTNIKILHENHFGMVYAFNKAFEACTGDAICFLAHDDILPPDSIEQRVTYLKEKRSRAIYCNGYSCTSEMKIISPLINCPKIVTWDHEKKHICRDNILPGALLMIRREIANNVFPIPEHLLLEDWWVVFNTLYYAGSIEYLDKMLFFYRLHGKNDSGKPPVRNFDTFLRKHWKKHIDYYDQLLIRLNRFDISDEEKQSLREVILINKQVVENTLEGRYTLPSVMLIKSLGLPKYVCSQVTIPHKAYLFVPIFNFIKRITQI